MACFRVGNVLIDCIDSSELWNNLSEKKVM